jgi:hypothetical protein
MKCISLSSHHMHITISGRTDKLTIIATAFTIYDILMMGDRATHLL